MSSELTITEQATAWLKQLNACTANFNISEQLSYKIPAPEKAVLLEALKHEQHFLRYLDKQPEDDVLLAAMNEDGYCISMVARQSEVVQLAAVKNQRGAIEYIDNPTVEMQVFALTHDMEPGYFDSENLAFYSHKFSDEALAQVSPILVLTRQLYEGQQDVNDMTLVYESLQPLTQQIELSEPPDSLSL